MTLILKVNGVTHQVSLDDPDTPLVFVLREKLGLTGTKYSCLQGLCGACTIHLDGEAVRACQMSAQEAEGADLTTIEGLSENGNHPVQQAWMEEQVAQCGWCQPGQIMQASAFLSETPDPSAQDIRDAMDGHICRCGTGPRILKNSFT